MSTTTHMAASPSSRGRAFVLFGIMGLLFLAVAVFQSGNLALQILQLSLISAIMSLGVNMQWGYAGLFNVGVMGFAALGGVAAVLVSMPPVREAWAAGGPDMLRVLVITLIVIGALVTIFKLTKKGTVRSSLLVIAAVGGYIGIRLAYDPAVDTIESVNPAATGYLGGLDFPILLSWPVGALLAAGAAWMIGKISLGLRADYLAIATLGISEILVAIMKNEAWLARGVNNVNGLPRPVPYEVDLQQASWFQDLATSWGIDVVNLSSLWVKGCYILLFLAVLAVLLWLSERALHSPWGRMMRAIRDNETAANAMGKDVKARHLQIFVLGSAVIGMAGAMLVTLDGQFTPGTYQPLRFTFLIWVMTIVGGSGNNWGAVLGGMLIWFFWIEAEPAGLWFMNQVVDISANMGWIEAGGEAAKRMQDSAAYMRYIAMGLILILVLKFAPKGLLPEPQR